MKTCPACSVGMYDTHTEGTKKRGYCEHCAYETEETVEREPNTPQSDSVFTPYLPKKKKQ